MHTQHLPRREAAGTAVSRGLRLNVGATTVTTSRTSTGTSSQTFHRRFWRWEWFAHPGLFNLVWMNHIALTWRIPWDRGR